MLSKIFGIGVVAFFINKSVNVGEEQFSFFVNFTKNIVVSIEIKGISKMIYIDYVISHDCNIPDHAQETWSEYIRANMISDDQSRDLSQDHWDNHYQVNLLSNDLGQEGFEVRSAGPDEEYQTSDDVTNKKYCY